MILSVQRTKIMIHQGSIILRYVPMIIVTSARHAPRRIVKRFPQVADDPMENQCPEAGERNGVCCGRRNAELTEVQKEARDQKWNEARP